MKRIFYPFLLFSIINFSQSNPANISLDDFTKNLDALVGAVLQMKECNDEYCDYASGEIYVDIEKRLRYNGKKKGGIRPNYTKLRGNKFEVISVSNNYGDITLELSNTELGTIFLKTLEYSISNYFSIVEIKMPSNEELYCNNFLERYDKFDQVKSIFTTINVSDAEELSFFKVIDEKNNQVKYYARFNLSSSSPIVFKKGVYMIFDDGSQVRKPEVDVDTKVSDYRYRDYDLKAAFEIDEELFNKFSNNLLTDVKLYTRTKSFDTKFGEKMKARFNCLINDTYDIIEKFN